MIKWIKWIDADLCGALGNAGKWNFKGVRWGYNSKLKTFLVRWMLIKITCSKHLTLNPSQHGTEENLLPQPLYVWSKSKFNNEVDSMSGNTKR